jgi:hypothetical protein
MHTSVMYIMNMLFQTNSKFPGNMPVSITREILYKTLPFGYVATLKADGDRIWMFVYPTELVLVHRNMNITLLPCTVLELQHFHVFDCELLGDRILLFDTLVYDGIRTLAYGYLQRCEYARLFCAACPSHERIFEQTYMVPSRVPYVPVRALAGKKLEPKTVFTLDKLDRAHSCRYPSDGVIFMQLNQQYAPFRSVPLSVLKYKPRQDMTIDFQILMDWGLQVVDSSTGKLVIFAQLGVSTHGQDGQIWECRFVEGMWQPIKHRLDKCLPNTEETARATVLNIKENITMNEIVHLFCI